MLCLLWRISNGMFMRKELIYETFDIQRCEYRWRGVLVVVVCCLSLLFTSCSTTRKLTENEVLYTGVKKIDVHVAKGVKLDPAQKSAISSPLSYPPNNPLFSPYYRTPFPIGLWVYNWDIKKEKGLKWWLYRKLSRKPVLIDDVQAELRRKMVENGLNDFGFFDSTVEYTVIPNKRNPKKAKISYRVEVPEPYRYGMVELWGWSHEMDSIMRTYVPFSRVKEGQAYDVFVLEEERANIAKLLRNRGYYYFQPDYVEFLADTTRKHGVVDVRIGLKQGVPAVAFQPYTVNRVAIELSGNGNTGRRDTINYDGLDIIYTPPIALKPRILSRTVKIRPGQPYSLAKQDKTQVDFVQLGVFKYANLTITAADSTVERALDFKINADYALPIETEVEVDVASKSNNLLGPGLILGINNKNLFRRAENLSFKFTGAYEWQIGGNKDMSGNSGLINSYELGINANLSVPRLLVPRFLKSNKDRREQTHFQVGTDFLNRHSFFRMISFWGSATYEYNSSRRNYHSIVPFKLNYTYLLKTSHEFDSTLNVNPAIKQSFRNQFIPSMSYTYTYDRTPSFRNPNRFFWQSSLAQAGNLIAGIQYLAGNREGEGKNVFGNRYSQFLKATSELIVYRRMTETSQLATRFMGGLGYAYGNSNVMPYSEQFYIGGANSIRAFQIRSIGPGGYHQSGKNVTGYLDQTGDIKLEANVEARFKIYGRFHGAFFVDAGNVWLLRKEAERPRGEFRLKGLLKEVALGTGFGIRYDINFIVVRADLGVALHAPYDTGKPGYFNIPSYGFRDGIVLNLAIGYPF